MTEFLNHPNLRLIIAEKIAEMGVVPMDLEAEINNVIPFPVKEEPENLIA